MFIRREGNPGARVTLARGLTWNIVFSHEEAFEFCWSSFADEHNTFPKSTRRNVKLNKFAL